MSDYAERRAAAETLVRSFYSWTSGWSVEKNIRLVETFAREREIAALHPILLDVGQDELEDPVGFAKRWKDGFVRVKREVIERARITARRK